MEGLSSPAESPPTASIQLLGCCVLARGVAGLAQSTESVSQSTRGFDVPRSQLHGRFVLSAGGFDVAAPHPQRGIAKLLVDGTGSDIRCPTDAGRFLGA